MATPQQRNANIRLLACLVDDDDTENSDYRFLVDGQHVKYPGIPKPGRLPSSAPKRCSTPGYRTCGILVKLNELDFTQRGRVRRRVRVSTHPDVRGGKPVLVKLAVWPWEIPSMEAETAAYQWLSESGVRPEFLGHLTEGEGGRVVGLALRRLHGLGIKLGDISKHNFLVRDGHGVVLVDFETARRDCSPPELKDEINAVKSSLEDTSFRGGVEPAYE
ncbi:hypothetical protein F5B18DRAFT_663652 [Nemania serpens]|nr:hypothetical protein F5B18DRAFT_663652 [Nemania serpens]